MYSAKIDGEPTTFGTSGLLYRSNKLMYDRITNSLWSSLVGEPVIGELATRDDLKLDFFPVSLTTWEEWVAEHPETKLLSPETGYYSPRSYQPEPDPKSIYYAYRADPQTMFPIWNRDQRLEPKDEVLGLSADGVNKAYPIAALQELRVVNDTVGETNYVIVASSYSSDVRVFKRGDREFQLTSEDDGFAAPSSLVDADGTVWEVDNEGLRSTSGGTEVLPRVPTLVYFWFGWFAFFPDTLLFEGE